jgi:uncharacterized membrane protein
MSEFALALLTFLAAHSIPARPAVRQKLVRTFGERPYLLLYSLLSIGLLAWLISAAVRAPTIPLWPTTIFSYHLALALMLPASWLLVGGLATPNPLSVSLSRRTFDPRRPGLPGLVRHPVMWGFAIWSGVHAIANGDLVWLILFGGFLLFSLAGMKLLDRRKRRQLGMDWDRLARAGRGWTIGQILITFGGGALLYLAALWLHPILIGPNPGALLF